MGHYRATTTDRYVRSAGLYGDQPVILAALSDSDISHRRRADKNSDAP